MQLKTRSKSNPIVSYLRTCNLSPVACTWLDILVITAVLILSALAAFRVAGLFIVVPIVAAMLASWIAISFIPFHKLIRLESDNISDEFMFSLIWKMNQSGTRKCGFEKLLCACTRLDLLSNFCSKLLKHRLRLADKTANEVLLTVCSHSKTFASQHTILLEFASQFLNIRFNNIQALAMVESMIEQSHTFYAAGMIDCAEPNLYAGLTNLYKCDLTRARTLLIHRCQDKFILTGSDIFEYGDSGRALWFLRQWAAGFISAQYKFTNSKNVCSYVHMLLESKPSRAFDLLAAIPNGFDNSYLKPVCDLNKLKAVILKLDPAGLTSEQKQIAASFTGPRQQKAAKTRLPELVLCD